VEVALVTADEEARLVAVELRSGRIRRYVPTLAKPRSIEVVGEVAVVAHSELGALSVVRASTLKVEHVLRGLGEPRYTAAHPDGRHAYVADAERGEVVVLDVVRGRIVGRERVGARARHLTIGQDWRTLWVALGAKAVVDVARGTKPRARAPLAHGSVVTPGLGTGTLCVLDRHGGVRFRKTVARSSHDACIVTLS